MKQRAVRLVNEDGQHGAIARVADRLDINRETLRAWVKADKRQREQPEVVDLEVENAKLRREVEELERANEILKAASTFFPGTRPSAAAMPRSSTSTGTASPWQRSAGRSCT